MKKGFATKKPIVIEFLQLVPTWTGIRQAYIFIHGKPPYTINAGSTEKDKWQEYMDICIAQGYLPVKTLESGKGTQNADFGDYLIKGVQGEVYPCKPDIFAETYTVNNTL